MAANAHKVKRFMDRRSFLSAAIAGASTFGVSSAFAQSLVPSESVSDLHIPSMSLVDAVAIIESTTMYDDEERLPAFRAIQSAIDAVNRKGPYSDFLAGGLDLSKAEISRFFSEMPVLDLYDRAFDKVLREFSDAKVTGNPMVWYVYNMGILVKTSTCAFSIDLCHRKAPLLAPMLDFALCTHNHGDHYTQAFFKAMRGKPIITNFYLCPKWYRSDFESELQIGDVTVRCTSVDHNKYLPLAVLCFEVVCGKGENPFVIFHSGDACNASQMKTVTPHPDLFFGHTAIGFNFIEAAKTTMPAKLLMPVHHQELGHLGGPWRCVAFEDEPLKIVHQLRAEGFSSALPVWGDRVC